MVECFNNLLRDARLLPITACFHFTLNQTVKLFVKKMKLAWDVRFSLPKYNWMKYVWNKKKGRQHTVEVYDLRNWIFCITTAIQHGHESGHAQVVHIRKRTYTCGKFQQCNFPCSHVMAACFSCGVDPIDLMQKEHSFHTYQATFDLQFHPLREKAIGWYRK